MNDIKIRYVLKSKCTGKISFKWYYIQQIEKGLNNLFDLEHYTIIERDRFTGLKDKNEKEIYENDIVNFRPMKKYKINVMVSKVVFKNNCWCLENNKTYLKDNFSLTGVEVIGNIHENPELSEKND